MNKVATPRGFRDGGRFFSRSPEVRQKLRIQVRLMAIPGDYATLGLAPSASKVEVKNAYKRLALKYHPDVVRRGDMGGQEKTEAFKEIKFAYENLMAEFEEEDDQFKEHGVDEDEWDEWDEWMGYEGGMPILFTPY
ncbi:uncharacterized protein A4U43_C02F6130 [Asparagus officinalis]|uniref:J domain-containing protein n=1 Tax=Asparagus officinalis TaxID=4686 RepID=A0A5P1FKD7_ASPOF|nr:chaperone protein dnaJ 8, chloroplastic-like [Asparagus officinalis]ONK77399.1 uncharacterized protein A4U43_C02F6130 [Asparagus officinalis]